MQQLLLPAQFPTQNSPQSFLLKTLLVFCAFLGLLSFAEAKPLHSDLPKHARGLLSDTLITASICTGDSYVFDGDTLFVSGEYVATYVGSDGSDSTVTLQLTVLPTFEVQLEATICEGEEYAFNGALLTQSGEYVAELTASNGCDSTVILHLEVLPPVNTAISAGICIGTTYVFEGEPLTESGVYSAILTAESGCDSIVTLTLDVVDKFVVNRSASICAGDFFVFAGDTLTAEGSYTDSLKAIGGCDSLIVLKLSLLPNSASAQTVTLCEGVKYVFFGDTLTVAGDYQHVLVSANGCDSTITLTLNYVTSFETTDEQTICDGNSYVFGTQILETAGEYVQVFQAVGGCDSTVTLTLNVLPRTSGTDGATICAEDSFEYQGEVLTDEGEYTFILQGSNGCDSVVTFTLTVLPAIGTSFEATICAGDSYDFGDQNLTDAGVYEAIYTAENGCDSVVTLTLEVLPTQETALSAVICAGEAYDYNGELLVDSGVYSFLYSGENGCDSTVVLTLTVLPLQETNLEASICAGESYAFNGNQISDAGTYVAVYEDENGCDSTVILVLEVLPNQETTLEAVICDNQTYTFNGEELNVSGTYTAELTGENGCDSTVVLTLTVLPTQASGFDAVICQGEVYSFFGIALTDEGSYSFNFEGTNGCDSIVTVNLSVLPTFGTSLEATICDNEVYDYNGESLTEAGVYTFEYTAANGCDSTVTLQLNVLPTLSTVIANSLCTGATYLYDGDTLTSSGIYTYVYASVNGCDSTVTLVLEFVDLFETELDVAICNGETYVFGTDTLADAGQYSQTLTAAGGCDSIVILNLTILPLSEGSESVSICEGASYNFNGEILTQSGTYTAVLTGVNGCDSTAVLNLTVLPLQTTTLEATTCSNEGYPFNGALLTDSGTYTAQLVGSNGCDSTVVLILTVLPAYSETVEVTICDNEVYEFDGLILWQPGTYTATYQAANGCDSIITLELSVSQLPESSFAVTVCDGESFEYNGEVYTASGVYEFVYEGQGANGCDSLEILYLTIFPAIPVTEISAAICQGASYIYNGSILTLPGTYTFELSSAVGCDSVVALTLTVIPVTNTAISANICAGESYPFNGQLLTAPGIYTAALESVNGCDSIVVLTLTQTIVNTNVTAQGNTLIAQATNATFQWINCANNQPIAGATSNTFTPSQTGNYAVVVTQNGCTATSNCTFIQVVSTTELMSADAWSIQPNPAATFTRLVFESPLTTELSLEIYDLSGRVLHRQYLAQGAVAADIDLNELPNGMLMVRLSAEQGVSVKRLVKAGQ
ncbi:MAG TPA: T9SS type A sorting domain-containing protein [Saprospiraceae bacterium]|nr:T9SS type A sorting domain-containing protein [Saprospiraceae bacterium]